MTQKPFKYESDMTPKEKREAEIAKLKAMDFKEKCSHMWQYHKLILAAPIILIALIIGVSSWIYNMRFQDVLNIAVFNGFHAQAEVDPRQQLAYDLGITDHYSQLVIDNTYSFLDGSITMESLQKFVVMVSASEIDVLIAMPEVFEIYSEQEMFMDLTEVFTAAQLEGFEIVDNTAIDISGAVEANALYFGINYEPVYLMVLINADLDGYNQDGTTVRGLLGNLLEILR